MPAHLFEAERIPMKDFGCLGRRRCKRCGRRQEKVDNQSWGRVVSYSWTPLVGRCPGRKGVPFTPPRRPVSHARFP